MADLNEILSKLRSVKPGGNGYVALCPAHDDHDESLSISEGLDGRVLLKCHAGCSTEAVVDALGLSMADLFNEKLSQVKTAKTVIITTYDYRCEKGNLLYQSCRKSDKSFIFRRPDGNGDYVYNLKGVKTVPYRLPELFTAITNEETVYIPEGEKDVDNLVSIGLIATTNPMGAGKWQDSYSGYFINTNVVILPDNDEPGQKHAQQVAASLNGKAASIKVINFPGLKPKGDVSDWLANGGTAEQLKQLTEETPEWEPEVQESIGFETAMATNENNWPDPEPIDSNLLPVEEIPVEIIPESLKAWVKDVSHRMQVPVDFIAVSVMVECGAIIGTSCCIRPKAHDDWQVVPNLWGGVVGKPGTMKTAALNEAFKPLSRLEARANESYQEAEADYETEKTVFNVEKEVIKKDIEQAAKQKEVTKLDELKEEYQSLAPPPPPVWRRYKTSDSTVEKLGELLKDNPRGILIFRDELVGLLNSWEKDNRQTDRAFFLEAWNGYGSMTTDRIGRGTVHCDNLCISIFGGIQPARLRAYLSQAHSELKNDGLFQRMQLLIYPDDPTDWEMIDESPDRKARERAHRIIENLSNLDPVKHGALEEEDEKIPYFRFDPEAQQFFYKWLTELQDKIRNQDETPVMLEHLNKFRSLMPSLALIDHLICCAESDLNAQVSYASAERAAAWCEYLESHARRIYGLLASKTKRATAELAKKLKEKRLEDKFSIRDIYRNNWRGLEEKHIVKAACQELEEAGWIKLIKINLTGRQPKEVYIVNPKIYSKM